MLPASIELLLGSKSVEFLQRSSAPGSVSLESSSNDGVYGCPGEEVGRWGSTALARLELLQLPLGNCFPSSTLLLFLFRHLLLMPFYYTLQLVRNDGPNTP